VAADGYTDIHIISPHEMCHTCTQM